MKDLGVGRNHTLKAQEDRPEPGALGEEAAEAGCRDPGWSLNGPKFPLSSLLMWEPEVERPEILGGREVLAR